MPRTSRAKDTYGIYYVSQKSSSGLPLFHGEEDRQKFLSILLGSREKNNWKLYGYCITDSDAYHLIIDANGSDISKIMKGINISYSLYARKSGNPGGLYKERYKSTLIQDRETLIHLLCRIHEKSETDNCGILDDCSDCFRIPPHCSNCIESLKDAVDRLEKTASAKGITVTDMLADKRVRNDLIIEYRRQSTLSLKELGDAFGGLTESSICKIIHGGNHQ